MSKSHILLAAFASFAIFQHLSLKASQSKLYLVFGFICFTASTIMYCIMLLWRNFKTGSRNEIEVRKIDDALKVSIRPCRRWKVKAGQFVYLWVPSVGFWSFCQTHPFMITWWSEDQRGRAEQIECLVKIQDGFTRHLSNHTSVANLRLWIDGPYGSSMNYGDFGSVILCATGPGIAAQIPVAKQILEGFARLEVRTRRLYLVWQLDRESTSYFSSGIRR